VFVRELAGDLAAHFDPLNPNRRLAAICADLGVPFYDLLPALRRATPSHAFTAKDEWVLFNGSGHLNERGHALVAEALFQDLFENPERPSAPGAGSR
jgi:lysophospholipase L1-like esterase